MLSLSTSIYESLPGVAKREKKIVESILLKLKREKPQSGFVGLDDVMETIYSLRFLFSLFVGDMLALKTVKLERFNSDTRRYETIQYFIPRDPNTKALDVWYTEMFILLSHIENEFEEILNKWIEFWESNDHILTDLFYTYSGGSVFSKFLSYTKFLEAFHRNINDSKPFNSQRIKKINDEIKNLVKHEDKSIRDRYSDQINWVNNYNLLERLECLFSKFLTADMKTQLGIDSDFARRVKAMRNNLTHLNKKIEISDIKKMAIMNMKLKTVIHIVIFKSIGLTDGLLLQRLKTIQQSPI